MWAWAWASSSAWASSWARGVWAGVVVGWGVGPGTCSARAMITVTVVPAPTASPAAGVCWTAVPATGPATAVAASSKRATSRMGDRIVSTSLRVRPRRSGTVTVRRAAITRRTRVPRPTRAFGSGDCRVTVDSGRRSLSSPRSSARRPAASRLARADWTGMFTTDGTSTPVATAARIVVPTSTDAPGAGSWRLTQTRRQRGRGVLLEGDRQSGRLGDALRLGPRSLCEVGHCGKRRPSNRQLHHGPSRHPRVGAGPLLEHPAGGSGVGSHLRHVGTESARRDPGARFARGRSNDRGHHDPARHAHPNGGADRHLRSGPWLLTGDQARGERRVIVAAEFTSQAIGGEEVQRLATVAPADVGDLDHLAHGHRESNDRPPGHDRSRSRSLFDHVSRVAVTNDLARSGTQPLGGELLPCRLGVEADQGRNDHPSGNPDGDRAAHLDGRGILDRLPHDDARPSVRHRVVARSDPKPELSDRRIRHRSVDGLTDEVRHEGPRRLWTGRLRLRPSCDDESDLRVRAYRRAGRGFLSEDGAGRRARGPDGSHAAHEPGSLEEIERLPLVHVDQVRHDGEVLAPR